MERAPAPVMVRQQSGGEQAVLLRQLPPGFRFHPTDEELVVQYLRRKVLGMPLPAAVIPEVHDLFKLDPWDIPGASDGEKYFFAVRPAAGSGSKRAGKPASTASGYWKPAGGKEKPVVASRCGGNYLVGVKIPMVFVPRRRRGKGGAKQAAPPLPTDWAMHEYRLALRHHHKNGCCLGQAVSEEWVVCRMFQRDRPSSSRRQTPAGHDATAVHRTMPMPPPSPSSSSSSSSSSSCVTGSSGGGGSVDQQEEVSSS